MTDKEIAAIRARLAAIEKAERVTLMLAQRSGEVADYEWRPAPRPYCSLYDRREYSGGRPTRTHRDPPLPFHARRSVPGTCRVCGQPIYGGGGWRETAGPVSTRLTWHTNCTTTYFVMTKAADYTAPLILRQGMRCAVSGEPIPLPYPAGIEVDHEIPLFRVARDRADLPWFHMIAFWMTWNLRALTRAAHLAKCADEARERASFRMAVPDQASLL